jgi:hypothetical protein
MPNAGYSATSSNLSPASYQTGYSTSSAGSTSASQSSNPYLSGASSQSAAQSNAVGTSAYASQTANKLYSNNTVPSYAGDQALYQQQQLLTNSYGGQGMSYEPQSYQSQQSGLGYQSSANSYSAKQSSYAGTANASGSGMNSLSSPSAGTANSISDSFVKLSMKDSDQQQQHYGRSAGSGTTGSSMTSSGSESVTTTVATVGSTAASATSASASSSSASRSAASTTSAAKAPVATGLTSASAATVPMMPYNIVGQTGIPLAIGPQMYTDDYALLQQRAAMLPGYYDMSGYQQTATTIAGRDQNSIPAVLPYSVDTKITGRVDANSPGSLSNNQQQQQQQQQLAAHQQAYLNTTIPPGYNVYYQAAANSMLAGGYYNPAIFQLPTGTNTAAGVHLGGATNAQLPKYYPTATGFGDVNQQTQVQDYNKMYVMTPQSQAKAGTSGMTSTDLSAASYGKSHGQAFDKGTYHTGTPPPYNLPALATGGQAVTIATPAAAAAYRAQYGMPLMQHSQVVPHMQQQDVSMRGGQQMAGQMKTGGNKYNTTQYWASN